MRLGFGTMWERPPEPTWSYTPWSLRAALREQVEVADVGLDLEPWQVAALKVAHLRSLTGANRSTWRFSSALFRLAQRSFEREASRRRCDAVLQAMPLARVRNVPYYVYHDAGIDSLQEHRDPISGDYPFLPGIPARVTTRLQQHQREVFQHAAGVFAMSQWLADSLISRTGVDPSRVHVVNPGCNAALLRPSDSTANPAAQAGARRNRLLFIGKTFQAKGGDLVLDALEILRREHDPTITLTIAGPTALPRAVPDGVRFLGRIPIAEVTELYRTHHLFVMPSHIEAFGIVFAEALANGVPCIGRDAFAMPSIIRSGVNGDVIGGDDPHELATMIARVLADDEIYRYCDEHRAATAEHYSWPRAAREMLAVMGSA